MGRMPRVTAAVLHGAFSKDESEMPDTRSAIPADQPTSHSPVRCDPTIPVGNDAPAAGNTSSAPANVADSRVGTEKNNSVVLQRAADAHRSSPSPGIAKALDFFSFGLMQTFRLNMCSLRRS